MASESSAFCPGHVTAFFEPVDELAGAAARGDDAPLLVEDDDDLPALLDERASASRLEAQLLQGGAGPRPVVLPAAKEATHLARIVASKLRLLISIFIATMIVDMNSLAVIQCCQPLAAPALSDDEAVATAALFRALGDPARVKILNLIATSAEPVCACEFIAPLGLAQATVSHHLKKLTDAGLLDREQRGKWAYFSLNHEVTAQLAGLVDLQEVPA